MSVLMGAELGVWGVSIIASMVLFGTWRRYGVVGHLVAAHTAMTIWLLILLQLGVGPSRVLAVIGLIAQPLVWWYDFTHPKVKSGPTCDDR